MMQKKSVSIHKVRFNVGALPVFSGVVNDHGIRVIEYRADHWVDNFPLIWSNDRQFDALEINLFLEHRYKGLYRAPKRAARSNPLGGISLKTLQSIANSLCIFLSWLEEKNVDWRQVTAQAATQRAKYWLPVYRFRKFLIDLIQAKSLGRDSANLYMTHVRQFYEWARRRGTIEKLPFEYQQLHIKPSNEHLDINSIFSMAHRLSGITVQTSDLTIPRKYRQKSLPSDQLSPYTREELSALYGTRYINSPARRLWVDLALFTGMRAFEIAQFQEAHVVDPSTSDMSSYHATITGKGNKERQILIPRTLMQRLWRYKNCDERIRRVMKWEVKNGTDCDKPLFINRSGLGISEKSVSNTAIFARNELSLSGCILDRSFHDLRSTYATNLAKYMLDKGLESGFIEFKLMALLGHSNFSTTRKYLNFARTVTFDSEMKGWSDTIFDGIDTRLVGDYQHLLRGSDG
ncbi:tyrosine-type recombinase/integrase [Bermanella sp. WJH001]|uniref:tyrosine-type recombinase/integrase n=1 Tax=Bermanella sp. WJH001 TaxID=3048005 RepID=UPI00297A6B60|nr:site-specific integrase [Bermanella sp. WJH001]